MMILEKKNKNENTNLSSNVSFGNIGGPASNMNPSKSHPISIAPPMSLFNSSESPSVSKSLQSQPKLQEQNEINLEAEIWDGPELYESGFYRSEEKPKEIKEKIIIKLKELSEKRECLDYNENGYEIDGRMFDNNNGDMSEFRVTIWKNENNNKYQSIVHVRKQGGDGFLYSELQDEIINNLNNLKPKKQQQQHQQQQPEEEEELNMLNNNPFSFEFDLDIEIEENDLKSPLSSSNIESLMFNSNSNMNSNSNCDSNSNSNFNLNKLDYNFDLSLPQEEEDQEGNNLNENENKNEEIEIDKEQYIKEIIEEVCNKENYMENIQNSTCLLLKLNEQDTNTLFNCDKNIIVRLLTSIQDQFDVQQIRNILIVCQRLLQLNNDKYNEQQNQNYFHIINSIQGKWKNGATRTIGTRTIKFGHSQQIVKCCNKCISLLK